MKHSRLIAWGFSGTFHALLFAVLLITKSWIRLPEVGIDGGEGGEGGSGADFNSVIEWAGGEQQSAGGHFQTPDLDASNHHQPPNEFLAHEHLDLDVAELEVPAPEIPDRDTPSSQPSALVHSELKNRMPMRASSAAAKSFTRMPRTGLSATEHPIEPPSKNLPQTAPSIALTETFPDLPSSTDLQPAQEIPQTVEAPPGEVARISPAPVVLDEVEAVVATSTAGSAPRLTAEQPQAGQTSRQTAQSGGDANALQADRRADGQKSSGSAQSNGSSTVNAKAGRPGAAVDGMPSHLPGNPAPPYPREALTLGLEGRVVLEVDLTEDGEVSAARVSRSSGHASLDKSALETVRRWRFKPASQGGRPIKFRVAVPIRFSLGTVNR